MKKPNFFIVGAPKSGTTAMNEYLKAHPQIFIPKEKEMHFFGSDINIRRAKPLTLDKYLTKFASVKNEERIGESSVWYLYSETAAAEIREFNPLSSIIVMLRNPVDMIYSLHSQLLFTGDENIESFKKALEAEKDRKGGKRIPSTARFPAKCLFYSDVAKYSDQIRRYFKFFGRENVHIIIYDDFKEDNLLEFKKVCQFLNVNSNFTPELRVINPNKKVRSKILRRLLKNPPELVRRLLREIAPSSTRAAIYEGLMRLNTKYQERPPMDKELRQQLQREFLPEIRKLSNLLKRDLIHWCQ